MTTVLSLQRFEPAGLDPCWWSGLSCDSTASCDSGYSKPATTFK